MLVDTSVVAVDTLVDGRTFLDFAQFDVESLLVG